MKKALVLAIVAGAASVAAAQQLGYTVVYTDQISDSIGKIESVGVTNTLVNFGASDRLAWLFQGPNSDWYVANGPSPVGNPSDSKIQRVTGLFSGAATVTTLASNDPLQNPVGIIYDSASNDIITLQNPAGPVAQGKRDGISRVNFNTGAVTMVYDEPSIFTTPRPRYEAGHHIVRDNTAGSSNYIISCVNGGVFTAGTNTDPDASTLWYFDASTNTPTLLADLSGSLAGGGSITRLTGITAIAGDNDLFAADTLLPNGAGAIYRIVRDDVTGAVTAVNLVLGGLTQPEQLLYNPYNNTILVGERGNYDGISGDPAQTARIFEMNLDGSNVRTLATGVFARGLAVIPAPGTLAMVGLAGLAAARRRRA